MILSNFDIESRPSVSVSSSEPVSKIPRRLYIALKTTVVVIFHGSVFNRLDIRNIGKGTIFVCHKASLHASSHNDTASFPDNLTKQNLSPRRGSWRARAITGKTDTMWRTPLFLSSLGIEKWVIFQFLLCPEALLRVISQLLASRGP